MLLPADLLGRGEDVERAEAEDPAEDALVEARVVDLLEARVGDALVEHALGADHPARGDQPLLVAPVPHHEADVAERTDAAATTIDGGQ